MVDNINDFNIYSIIDTLSKTRKIFHSEADFQFSIAWEIKKKYPNIKVRLEYINKDIDKMHLDILLINNDMLIPIELKYVTKSFTCELDKETYTLKDHSAQDLRRYDFIKDISRIEECKEKLDNFQEGYSIMITNDKSYYKEYESNRISICHDFRIHQGNSSTRLSKWRNNPSIGSIKGRESDINLKNDYTFNWQPYSNIENEEFKILIVKID